VIRTDPLFLQLENSVRNRAETSFVDVKYSPSYSYYSLEDPNISPRSLLFSILVIDKTWYL